MAENKIYRPVGYSNSTVQMVNVSNTVEITAYLWGGGGGAGGNFRPPSGPNRLGGNGTAGGFAQVTFTLTPSDNLTISVGGPGEAASFLGGAGGRGYLLGSTSFSGARGGDGSGPGGGGGGGGGGATVLYLNGTLLAVAGGGAGGGGCSSSGDGLNAPGTGSASFPASAGQNGQSKNPAYTGGGGGAGGGGYGGGNGATLDIAASPAAGGGLGQNFGPLTGSPNGILPAFASNPYRRGAGNGGSNQPDVNGFTTPNGTAGIAVLEFSYVPGLSVKYNGVWEPVKTVWIKRNGAWREVKALYLKTNGQWRESLNGIAPNFVNASGFGFAPRSIQPQDGPTPPPLPFITGNFTGPTFSSQNNQDQVSLTITGPDAGTYEYTIAPNPSVSFDTTTGNPNVGFLQQYQTALVSLVTPHPTTTLTAFVTRPGYQNFQAEIVVPERSRPSGKVEFTRAGTSGQWIVPPGVFQVRLTLVGGGGGGAAGSEGNPNWSGGGGGGSGGVFVWNLSVQPGDKFNYRVGQGGGGTNTSSPGGGPGGDGTSSSVSYESPTIFGPTLYSVPGGTGGGKGGPNARGGHWNSNGVGGSPGGSSGQPGQVREGESANRNLMPGGAGGSAQTFGFGGAGAPGVPSGGTPTAANQNGQPGTGYGGGGGGGAGGKNDSPQGQGAAGAGGLVIIEWG